MADSACLLTSQVAQQRFEVNELIEQLPLAAPAIGPGACWCGCSMDADEARQSAASWVGSPFAASVYELSVFLSLPANPLVESGRSR